MPNWCENRLEFSCETKAQADQIREFLSGDNGEIDFNNIKPMPEILRHTVKGGKTFDGETHEVWFCENPEANFNDRIERPLNDDDRAQLLEAGSTDWYDWSCDNWGTKWNAAHIQDVEQDSEYLVYRFDTAWSPPQPIIEALREMYPDIHITAFYDEPGMEVAGYL